MYGLFIVKVQLLKDWLLDLENILDTFIAVAAKYK